MNTDKADLLGLIYIKIHGLQIRIKNKFVLRGYPSIQITHTHAAKTYQISAQKETIRFSMKDFEWNKQMDWNYSYKSRNEITFWLTMEEAKKLKEFLIKNA